jgi:hypothetical protein
MADPPTFDESLRQALARQDNEDVRIFYDYFEDLKWQARRHLNRKAAAMPGASAVAQSALLSLFCDLALQQVLLSDVDEYGYPMLWPLMLKYLERHCDKWNKYYLAKKRKGAKVSLGGSIADEGGAGSTPPTTARRRTRKRRWPRPTKRSWRAFRRKSEWSSRGA